MNSDRLWAAAGKALAAVAVALIAVTALASGASAVTYKVLHKFTGGADGAYPHDFGGLAFDASGAVYGTTLNGGDYDAGVVFKLTPNPDGSWTETALHSFTGGGDGGNPVAGPIFDAAGTLYGLASVGGAYNAGVFFTLTSNLDGTWSETVLHDFTGADGNGPEANMTFDAAGNLYGTTVYGGVSNCGTVFELVPNGDGSWNEKVLHSFTCKDGAIPESRLIFDPDGALYGTAVDGGNQNCYIWAPGCGVVFKLTPNPDGTWTEKVLHKFTGGKDGSAPQAELTFDKAGNLYGTTCWGGAYGSGTAFKLSPQPDGSWKEKVIHQFTGGKDGAAPYTVMILGGDGSFYSTTFGGGAYGAGVVFKLTLGLDGKWREKIVHTFRGKPAGIGLNLSVDPAGNFYGVTRGFKGIGGYGAVYEITP